MAAPRDDDFQDIADPETYETQLLIRVAQGDREAFARLFDRVAPSVLGILERIVRRRSLAEEALQETFLQGWLQANRYQPEQGTPRQWLFKIARSRGLDQLRREGSRQRREERFDRKQDRGHLHPVGTVRLERSERRRSVRAGLAHLTAPQRACLALAFGEEDLTQSEIAARLKMPLGSVKSRVRLGMRKLEGVLAAEAGY